MQRKGASHLQETWSCQKIALTKGRCDRDGERGRCGESGYVRRAVNADWEGWTNLITRTSNEYTQDQDDRA
jgi:hypothetical protein